MPSSPTTCLTTLNSCHTHNHQYKHPIFNLARSSLSSRSEKLVLVKCHRSLRRDLHLQTKSSPQHLRINHKYNHHHIQNNNNNIQCHHKHPPQHQQSLDVIVSHENSNNSKQLPHKQHINTNTLLKTFTQFLEFQVRVTGTS